MRLIPTRQTLIRGGIASLVIALILSGTGYWAIWTFCVAYPPDLEELPPIVDAKVIESEDGYRRIGESYFRKKDGIMRMKVVGDPYTRGYSIGRLTEEYIEQQEAEFLDTMRDLVPGSAAQWLLKVFITIRNRNLPDFVSADHQMEIYGYVSANEDKFAHIGPVFHRKLNYHAAHDIGHAVIDNPLVGCTSFAAWGDYTKDGHLIMGRTFDFDVARSFDTNKLVYYVAPEVGNDFIFVAWPGMIGVVSGINEHKIAVVIDAAHSDDSISIGTPVALVVRDVMQYATTLEEAIELIEASTVFVNELFMVADGKTGRAVVVEKSPKRCEVREAEGSVILAANHFMTETFQKDIAHLEYMEQGTSQVRYDRTQELLAGLEGELSPVGAVSIVRDRAIPDSDENVMGNPASINMLSATHAVVFDVTAGVIWVSASPHQLGAFVPFGFDDFEAPAGASIIAADPMLDDGSYERYTRSMVLLEEAEKRYTNGELDAAMDKCIEAELLNLTDYRIFLMQTRIAVRQRKWDEAFGFATAAKSFHVAYGNEREELETLIAKINKNKKGS